MKYLEVKVVKVEKKRVLDMNPRRAGKSTKYWSSFSNEVLERLQINTRRELERRKVVEEEPKGNWVNGENLDKIKFPCFCSYICNSQRWFGEINKSWMTGEGTKYHLSNCNIQKQYSMVTVETSLKNLIKDYDIHILKGKIIIFDER